MNKIFVYGKHLSAPNLTMIKTDECLCQAKNTPRDYNRKWRTNKRYLCHFLQNCTPAATMTYTFDHCIQEPQGFNGGLKTKRYHHNNKEKPYLFIPIYLLLEF